MDVKITDEAKYFIEAYSGSENEPVYKMIGKAMTFSKQPEYKQHQALLSIQDNPRAISCLLDSKLGICHFIREDKIVIFRPSVKKSEMTKVFFDEQLRDSSEFLFT